MRNPGKNPRWWKTLLVGGIAAPACCLALSGQPAESFAQAEKPPITVVAPPAGLSELRHLSLDKQPALRAYRASLSAAVSRADGLEQLRLAGLVRIDLHVRKSQSQTGIAAAEGRLAKAEWDTLYAVTRNYWSVVYARQQIALADELLTRLPTVKKRAEEKSQDPNVKVESYQRLRKWNLATIDSLIETVRGRRQQALQGNERALAALREAIGVDADCPPLTFATELPELKPSVNRDDIVALALKQRGEIKQAQAAIEATALEIKAQGLIIGPRAETFAVGSDLHAEPVPQGEANGEYRPGAVGIEMPSQMVGPKKSRVDQASHLHDRALAVADKAARLITLEAQDAVDKWLEASTQATHYAKALDILNKNKNEVEEALTREKDDLPYRSITESLDVLTRITQLRLQLNEARYHALLALAALERITAGGFNPGFAQCK